MSVEPSRSTGGRNTPTVVVKLPGIQRYVQSHTLLSGYRKGEPVYDMVWPTVWVEDTQVLRAQADTPEYAAVRADEPHFIDLSTMGSIITQEHTIKDESVPPNAVKNMEFVTHRADLSIEAFQHHWRAVHGPLGAAIPVVRRYVQSHTRLAAYRAGKTPVYDGVAITWFADTQAMRASAALPEYAATRADEANFIDGTRLPFIITREHVIVG